MVVSTKLRATGNAYKVPISNTKREKVRSVRPQEKQHGKSSPRLDLPAVQFPCETAVLRLSGKESRHDFVREDLAISDDKGAAVGKPANGIMVPFVSKDGHQTLGENVLAIIIVTFLLVIFFFDFFLLSFALGFNFFFGTHVVVIGRLYLYLRRFD